MCQSNS